MGFGTRQPTSNDPDDELLYDDFARRLNEGAKSLTGHCPDKCSVCGATVRLNGQCSKCKAEQTVIEPLPEEGLTDCQYKDFYG